MTPLSIWLAYAAIFAVIGTLLFYAMRGLHEALKRVRRNEHALAEQNLVLEAQRAAVQASEARWHSLVDHAPALIINATPDGAMTFVNHQGPQDVLGQSVEAFVDAPYVARVREAMAQALAEQRDVQYEVAYTPEGQPTHWYNVHVGPVWNQEAIAGLTFIAFDVTERKQAAADRERLIGELEAKNAELERFTYTVSHDLKSPLVTIKGFLGFLQKDINQGDAQRTESDIKEIRNAVDKMARLLKELLALSRIGRMVNAPEAIALSELATEAVSLVSGQVERRGVLVEIDPQMPVVQGDRMRLLEVYQNLLDNAVKFMGDQPEPLVEIGADQRGDDVVCYVKDNGIGIDARHFESVFGLFNRLDLQQEGTGIGLALVKRIVEVHKGKIWVESEGKGQGSTFFFTLRTQHQ